jgi:hypothetical protein
MRSVRVRVTLQVMVYGQSVRPGNNPLETNDQWFFQLNTCGCSPYVTSTLTRGWVCRLQLLLVLASAVILRSEFRGIHNHVLQSQFRDSPTWRTRSPYLYPPGTGWRSYTSRHWAHLCCGCYTESPLSNGSMRHNILVYLTPLSATRASPA